jgi:hypothetical protein
VNVHRTFSLIIRGGLPALLLLSVTAFSGEGPHGTVPRASAEKYPAHIQQGELRLVHTCSASHRRRRNFQPMLTVAAWPWRWQCIRGRTA